MFRKIFICALLLGTVISLPSIDAIKIEINKGEVKPEPIAILRFVEHDGSVHAIAKKLQK